ncbi:RNA polymerase sigma factor [Nocardia altamirensis]|uniref:RNA polymerase sigma factor n=1 Tax=Nocardia altamirensis TaxID=472158 RepID=UPI0008401B9E|nr:sigma-70 family RNA polymerase sigma factor [Nocardia altamirensis]
MSDSEAPSEEYRFDEIFRLYSPAVFRFALRAFRGDSDQAQEIVQQVFIAVWRQYDRDFKNTSILDAIRLIMKIAARRVIDAWRKNTRSEVLVSEYLDTDTPMLGPIPGQRDPLLRIIDDADLETFRRVLEDGLTETEYRVAIMAWEFGLLDRETAEVLDCTVSTVQSHKSRARKKIEAIMNGERAHLTFDDVDTLMAPMSSRPPENRGRDTRTKGVTPA